MRNTHFNRAYRNPRDSYEDHSAFLKPGSVVAAEGSGPQWNMARKLKIMENEKHPLEDLKNDKITEKLKNEKCTL